MGVEGVKAGLESLVRPLTGDCPNHGTLQAEPSPLMWAEMVPLGDLPYGTRKAPVGGSTGAFRVPY